MPHGHYKKVIDPRTRAEVAPEVVPFWHVKIGDPNKQKLETESNPTSNTTQHFQNINASLQSLKNIDFVSAFLSFVAFLTTCGVLARYDAFDSKIHLLSEEIAFVKNEDPLFMAHLAYSNIITTGAGKITGSEQKSCLEDWTPAVICRNYTKINQESPVMLGLPEIITTDIEIYSFYLISFILLFSTCIQFYRYSHNRSVKSTTKIHSKFDVKEAEQTKQTEQTEYRPTKPDFWRWFEYACTSPFQVLLVSASLLIANWTLLLTLCFLQFALIWFGFMLEKRINKLYRSERPLGLTKCSKTIILLLSAWLCFGVIWGILIWKLFKNDSNAKNCKAHDDGVPKEVLALVIGQGLCFLFFGLLQTCQVFSAFGEQKSQENRELEWLKYTWRYSFLSVTSKVYLDVTLITVVVMNSKTECNIAQITEPFLSMQNT